MWVATTSNTSGTFGSTGSFFVFGQNSKESMTLPERCNMTTQRSSFASWTRGGQSRKYICGSATDNLVFTEHKSLARLGIEAPTQPLVNTATPSGNEVGYQAFAGGGLTGSIIPYIRFYDALNNRRSPLSGPGTAINLVNQGLELEQVPDGPDSADAWVTHVEVWASQDGGLPRFWFRRDIGAPTINSNSTSLGEAEIETISLLPRCKFSVLYHDRHALAGDDRHPDRLYFSVSGEPEQYAGFWISTRQGEPIIGLFVVRDILIVQCPNIHYMVQGYDENDIQMDVLEPYIGGLGHHTMTPWNDKVVIPGTIDWYECDGTSMRPLLVGLADETWRRSIISEDYVSTTWSTTDVASGLVKFCSRDKPVSIYGYPSTSPQTYFNEWVLDLRGDAPELMFDIFPFDISAGAQLALPGYYKPQSYVASAVGVIYRENSSIDSDAGLNIEHRIHTAHQVVVEPIDNSDCVRFVKAWGVISNEHAPIVMGAYAGNEYAWRQEAPNDSINLAAQLEERNVGATAYYFVANDRKLFPLNKSSGSAISLNITCSNPGISPPGPLASEPNLGPFIFKGWGADYSQDGEQWRGPEVPSSD